MSQSISSLSWSQLILLLILGENQEYFPLYTLHSFPCSIDACQGWSLQCIYLVTETIHFTLIKIWKHLHKAFSEYGKQQTDINCYSNNKFQAVFLLFIFILILLCFSKLERGLKNYNKTLILIYTKSRIQSEKLI